MCFEHARCTVYPPNMWKGEGPGWLTPSSYGFRTKSGLLSQNCHRNTVGRKAHSAISL